MYVKDWCSYCRRAKALLDKKGVVYEEIDTTGDDQTREWLVERTQRRTVPQIFIGEVPIGGFDDLYALEKSGDLDRILAGQTAPTPIA
jgi:glutaredoxin 3